MSELIRCDGCGRELADHHTPRMWEVRQVGSIRFLGEDEAKHACSPECVQEVTSRLRGPT